ncbi:hypothetical protein TCARB_0811 [Thermofilum adornatum 1505]|uniref:Uncharacterized protein n=1 Tax=Thermofilum adornatum 1505 TaxID=697581 RepID=A0A3G1A6P5_9CREN|nr:hypothetical protein TCARB_0811 [Thermofilum adornatum 1505]
MIVNFLLVIWTPGQFHRKPIYLFTQRFPAKIEEKVSNIKKK